MNVPLQILAAKTPAPTGLPIVDEIITRIGDQPEQVVPLLQAIQEHYHYLPAEALRTLPPTPASPPRP